MSSSGDWPLRSRAPKPSVASAVGLSLRDQVSLTRAARWRWLEELRSRTDLAIELFDASLTLVLPAPPERAAAARTLIGGDARVRRAVTSTLKTLDAQTLAVESLRVRACPVMLRSAKPAAVMGVLVVGQPADAAADSEPDQRLAATASWLTAAVEAELDDTTGEAAAHRAADRLAGVIDVIDEIHDMTDERQIMSMTMEALALWFDADVRVYQQELSGAFQLHACLPGVDRSSVPAQLDGQPIWGRTDVFRLESARVFEALGWPGAPADTVFAAIAVEQGADWLVSMSPIDQVGEAILSVIGRVVGSRLSELHHSSVDRDRREIAAVFSFGDAPFDATARAALEAVARQVGADAASVTLYYDDESSPALTVAWGVDYDEKPPQVEPGSSLTSRDAIAIGARASAGVALVLALRNQTGAFTAASARLAREAAASFATWIAGALIRRGEIRVPSPSEYTSEFVGRLRTQVDRLGRLRVGGAVAVVMPDVSAPSGQLVDTVMQIVHEQVRSSDVVGMLEAGGAGVLLPDATAEVASAVVGRLLTAARTQGLVSARVGVATFAPASESPETLLSRALMSARRGASLS